MILEHLTRTVVRSSHFFMSRKLLVAFDFDDTLLDANSDVVVQTLSPSEIPAEVRALRSNDGWTNFMGEVFRHLHKEKILPSAILSCIGNIPYVAGMPQLLQSLAEASADVIIISDANSVFIEHSLKNSKLSDCVSRVYTNPAQFDDDGRLHISGYHKQDWCKLSTWNLCKGHVLTTHINEIKDKGVVYDRVAYVGDGSNDLCPSLRLTANDLVFPRKGFRLIKEIEKGDSPLLAKVVPWDTGAEILDALQLSINGKR